jgi:DNA polymerase-3 subunit delta'
VVEMARVSEQPETFAGIAGNEAVLRLLERALESGSSHAYLFHGPPGVGKRAVARRFGAALVAGGDTAAESRARRGLHPDLAELRPEGQFTTIGQAREVARLAASRPFEGARRVFILEADTLNVQAANALLKTLEDPEGEPVFVLLASSREGVLPTVASRAQAVRFNPVPLGEVEELLAERGAEDPGLAAALGRGSVGLSIRYAEEEELAALRAEVFAAVAAGGDFEDLHRGAAGVMTRAEAVGDAAEAAYLAEIEEPDRRAKESARRAGRAARDAAVREALDLLSLVYRDAAVVAAGAGELAANSDKVQELRQLVAARPSADWTGAALAVGEARSALAYNVSPEATLEVVLSRTLRLVESSRGS